MRRTREPNPNLDALLQRAAVLPATVVMTQEELEEQLHAEVWRGDWQEALRLLELAGGHLSRKAANECAVLAVQKAGAEELAAILNLLPPGECAECDAYPVDWSPTGEVCRRLQWDVSVQGTLLMHAVAVNCPEAVELLLRHGYDVNCASPASASALMQNHFETVSVYGRDYIPFHPHTARPESRVQLRKWDSTPESIHPLEWEGATPLALAILLGHGDCACILAEHGAWLEEAPSVSAAMYLFWRERDPGYQAARAAVLSAGDTARHRPVLWAVGEICSPRQLSAVLETWNYDRRELIYAARRMVLALRHQESLWKDASDGWQALCEKICRIGRVCPEAVRDRSVIGDLLDEYLSRKNVTIEPLMSLLEGATLDISELRAHLCQPDRNGAQNLLTELAQRCRPVMDRDVIPAGTPPGVLRFLLKTVTFLPPAADEGVSGLTQAILHTGDLRLIRRALKTGLIPPEESTEELLLCQQMLNLPSVCRSALLTTQRPPCEPRRECPCITDMKYRWFREPAALQDRSAPEIADQYFWFSRRNHFHEQTMTAAGVEWQLHRPFIAACMAGRTDLLERWLRYLPPEDLRNIESVHCARRNTYVTLTPLCAAALGGQRETVELLLSHGALPREEISGSPSSYSIVQDLYDKGIHLPLNPVLAAALGGHWDIVECLLRHGATCDWAAEENRTIWSQFHPEDLPETAARKLNERRTGT